MAATNLVFVPWIRRGMAASITRPDQPGGPTQPITTFAVTATTAPGLTARVDLPLVGPGDIAGLDTRVITRMRPGQNESDAEFNHFVSIEFDQADLPWRYTPAAALNNQLTPWLTLLVLADNEWQLVPPNPSQKLAAANVTNTRALPPLGSAWANAHVQLHGAAETATTPAALAPVLEGQPGLFVARLLSTRILAPQTRYTAMLVPTYSRGVLAGLGQPVPDDMDALTPAWTGAESTLTLPIYHQWQFQTGVVGDFESLVRSLKPEPVDQSVGRRDLDVSKPGFDLKNAAVTPPGNPPPPPVTAMPMEGALQSLQASQQGQPGISTDWQAGIQSFVNTSTTSVNNVVQPLVAPPMYGRWHASETQLGDASRLWFKTLNRDPRHRATAGLGTLVVAERHQELLASAWSQIDGLLEANSQRKFLQLGREAFKRVFLRHIQSGSADSALLTLGGLQRWVLRAAGGITVHADVAGTVVGRPIFEPQWRRLARPRGPVGRRQLRHLSPAALFAPVTKIANGFQLAPPPPPAPSGAVTPAAIFGGLGGVVLGTLTPAEIAAIAARTSDTMVFWGILLFCSARKLLAAGAGSSWPWLLRLMRFGLGLLRLAGGTGGSTVTALGAGMRDGTLTGDQVRQAPGNAAWTQATSLPSPIPAPPPLGGTDKPEAAAFRGAYAALLDAFNNNPGLAPPVPAAMNVAGTLSTLLGGLSPELTLAAGPLARLHIDSSIFWNPADKLEPVQAAPSFPQPMWTALRDESVDWILPGLDKVPTNTVGLVVSNQRFIEAYMVGLNHEMARTLLWNGYPTDQRGTYFRQFWDSRATAGTTGPLTDIAAITSWTTTDLGTHSPRTMPPSAVLLVRGDLIRRYPNVVVYAVQGSAATSAQAVQTAPVFTGRLTTDVSFYGFPFSKEQVAGAPNFAFVLQEQPAEPRFALVGTPPIDPTIPTFFGPGDAGGASTAAEFAVKTCQTPKRIVIAGTLLVPQS